MSIIAEIVDDDNTVLEVYTAANAAELWAYARGKGLRVGSHGGEGGSGPTREVPSALLDALFKEHGKSSDHAQSAATTAIIAHMRGT